jgi:hypothetical protein
MTCPRLLAVESCMKYTKRVAVLLALPLLVAPLVARGESDDVKRDFQARLKGKNETPLTVTTASGTLQLTVNDADNLVHFVLTYSGIQTPVMFAHIHVGQPNVAGGVTVFFCGGGGRDACPQEGTVEGDFSDSDVLPLATQQLAAGDLATLLKAIRAQQTYVNVHSTTSPGGEIRGQIVPVKQ